MQSRNIRRRVVTAAAFAVAVGLVITGCSSGSSAPKPSKSAAGPVAVSEITFAHANITDPGQRPGLLAMIKAFNDSHPSIHVTPTEIPQPIFPQTITTQLAAGEGPDVIRFDPGVFYSAVDAGFLEPLDKVIDAKKLKLLPDSYTSVDGKRYGVLSSTTPYLLLYNTDLIKTPPKTFPEFVAAAKAATKDGVYGMAVRQTLPEENGVWQDINNYVYGFGGAWSDGKKLTLNSAKTVQGLEAYQQIYDANVIPKGATASTYRTMFAQGKVAMMIDNGGVVGAVLGINPNVHFASAPVPFPVDKAGLIVSMFGVNAKSKHLAAANTFLNWMMSAEGQNLYQKTNPASNMATAVKLSAEDQAKVSPQIDLYRKSTATGIPQLVPGFYADTPVIWDIVVKQVLSALAGQVTMKQAMDKAQSLAVAAVG